MTRRGRRKFLQHGRALAGLGLIGGCGLRPLSPQPARVRRIGFLSAPPLAPLAI